MIRSMSISFDSYDVIEKKQITICSLLHLLTLTFWMEYTGLESEY